MNSGPVVVTGVGVVSPVGLDAPSTAASIRARTAGLLAIPKFVAPSGAGAAGGQARGITDGRGGCDRLHALAGSALQEAIHRAEGECEDLDLAHGSLHLVLPPGDRPAYDRFETSDLDDLLDFAQCTELAKRRLVPGGHATGLEAIIEAARGLSRGDIACAIVGGLDSLLDFPALDWFDSAGRLRTDDRAVGFSPGESAAFLVLESMAEATRRGARPLARVRAWGLAQEPNPMGSSAPSRSEGLSLAVREALVAHGGLARPIGDVLCDANGERYRMREWAVVQSRALREQPHPPEVWNPVACTGDLGASTGVFLASVATIWLNRGWTEGDAVLVSTASDDTARAAMVLKRTAEIAA